MRATLVDDRMVDGEREAEFLVSIYEGGDQPGYSWSEASYLLADTDLSGVLSWLRENLPADCCWALGVVQRPRPVAADFVDWPHRVEVRRIPTFKVAWIVGGDVLNSDPAHRSAQQERLAQSMLQRRHSVRF
ncbi:MAG TPA: hypothetical protein VFY58_12320 [Nocardioides sp.]|nr:hypothetical protein [Nocardioides sp.]